jgi:hypothetical protein
MIMNKIKNKNNIKNLKLEINNIIKFENDN